MSKLSYNYKTLETNEKIALSIAISQKEQVNLIVHEGTARSAKTVSAIFSFALYVYNSKEYLHLIAAEDYDAIVDKILVSDGLGLLPQFEWCCSLKSDKIGGVYVQMKSPSGDKKILLAGYRSKDKWEKILGKTFGGVLIDEVNIADPSFVRETFARQLSAERPFQVWTLNGDDPTHYIYKEYINSCQIIGKAPASIRAEMDKVEKVKGRYYMHWTFKDNPIMTAEKIKRAMEVYPVGSFYYTTKILGERGAYGDLVFIDYISDGLVQDLKYEDYHVFTVGVDIGATKAQNSIALIGFKKNFTECAVFDLVTFSQCGYKQKAERLKLEVKRWKDKSIAIECILPDSAEQNFIKDLASEFSFLRLPPVVPSYKATIKQRIDMLTVLLATKRIKFNNTDGGKKALQAYKMAKWKENAKGKEREDLNEWQNDVMDSIEYALTRHMIALMTAKNWEK